LGITTTYAQEAHTMNTEAIAKVIDQHRWHVGKKRCICGAETGSHSQHVAEQIVAAVEARS